MAKNKNDNNGKSSRVDKRPKDQIKKLPAMQKKNSHRTKALQQASEKQVRVELGELELKKSTKSEAVKKTAKAETGNKAKKTTSARTQKPTQTKRKRRIGFQGKIRRKRQGENHSSGRSA